MIAQDIKTSKTDEAHAPQYNYIGVDLSKKTLDVWKGGRHRSYPNTDKGVATFIRECSRGKQTPLVAYESTGCVSLYFSEQLDAAGVKRKVLVPGRVRHFAKSIGKEDKTDKIDSEVITRYAVANAVQPDTPMEEYEVALRQRVRAHQATHSPQDCAHKYARQGKHRTHFRHCGALGKGEEGNGGGD